MFKEVPLRPLPPGTPWDQDLLGGRPLPAGFVKTHSSKRLDSPPFLSRLRPEGKIFGEARVRPGLPRSGPAVRCQPLRMQLVTSAYVRPLKGGLTPRKAQLIGWPRAFKEAPSQRPPPLSRPPHPSRGREAAQLSLDSPTKPAPRADHAEASHDDVSRLDQEAADSGQRADHEASLVWYFSNRFMAFGLSSEGRMRPRLRALMAAASRTARALLRFAALRSSCCQIVSCRFKVHLHQDSPRVRLARAKTDT